MATTCRVEMSQAFNAAITSGVSPENWPIANDGLRDRPKAATRTAARALTLRSLSCSQAGPRCRRPPASRHQHRAAAWFSGRVVSPVRGAWVESATIAHAQNAVANAAEVWLPCDKSRMQSLSLGPSGTEFLDAETGPPKSPPETTDARRDQKDPKPVAQTPAQTAYLNLTGNYPVRRDCLVADAVNRNPSPGEFPC